MSCVYITGADDLSCFLIDSTGERTTRTPKGRQKPINEYHRRKVIHYIAYADEYPDRDYDHGMYAPLCLRQPSCNRYDVPLVF
jgi:hypothetical protein